MSSGLYDVRLNRLTVLVNATEETARKYAEDLVLQISRFYNQPKRRVDAETMAAYIRSGRVDHVEISAWSVRVEPGDSAAAQFIAQYGDEYGR